MSKLYIVATPIGNLADITLRAISTLKEVDAILCEDTRTTGKLLAKYDIKNKTISYHANSNLKKESDIIKMLEDGKNLALVSDAGTPAVSDPGVLLVRHVRDALGDDVQIIPIPGPSALTSAISVAGVATNEFKFIGFLPNKKGRETIFNMIKNEDGTVIFYESTHRILKTLESLNNFVPERRVVLCRELTKIFEEVKEGNPKSILEYYTVNKDKVRGEFVVVVEGKSMLK